MIPKDYITPGSLMESDGLATQALGNSQRLSSCKNKHGFIALQVERNRPIFINYNSKHTSGWKKVVFLIVSIVCAGVFTDTSAGKDRFLAANQVNHGKKVVRRTFEAEIPIIYTVQYQDKEAINNVTSHVTNDVSAKYPKSISAGNRQNVVSDLSTKEAENHIPVVCSIDNGDYTKRRVVLTFDGGAYANHAMEILDTLRSRSVRATIFLQGTFIARYPEIVNAFVEEGHEIGNHTYSHPHLTQYEENRTNATTSWINEEIVKHELLKTGQIFLKITGRQLSPLWRAPFGETNGQINKWGFRAGFLQVGWKRGMTWSQSYDTGDWVPDPSSPGYHTPQEVLRKFQLLSDTQPEGINGAIILMHLGSIREIKEEQFHRYLGTFIDLLRDWGYELVTVSDMIGDLNIELPQTNPDYQ